MIKENKDRKEKFQLKTVLDKKNKKIYKEAISKSAYIFLKELIIKEKIMNNAIKANDRIKINKITKIEDRKIYFEFIE
jgi:hypothetical protein